MSRSINLTFFVVLAVCTCCSYQEADSQTSFDEGQQPIFQSTTIRFEIASRSKIERVVETTGVLNVKGISGVVASCAVLQSEGRQIKKGYQAKIYLPDNPAKEIRGVIYGIGPVRGDASQMASVSVKALGPVPYSPGMIVKIEIVVPGQLSTIISNKAIIKRSGKKVVFTISNGLAKWNEVVLGETFDGKVEILTGVVEGDSVILDGASQLAHNSKISLANDSGR